MMRFIHGGLKALPLLIFILSGCLERQPEEFARPSLGEVQVEAGYETVSFTVEAKGAWSECGVYFGEANGTLMPVKGERTETGFFVTVGNLEDDASYSWRAFVSNGREEILTEPGSVATEPSPIRIKIPDPGFKAYLTSQFDVDGDREISPIEACFIWRIQVCSDEWNIQSLRGIEYMPNLTLLHCWGSWIDGLTMDQPYYFIGRYRWDDTIGPVGTLMEVDVSRNPKLEELILDHNAGLGTRSRTIDVSHNPKLQTLSIKFTDWEYPDVSALTELRILNLSHLHGTPPDITRLSKLRELTLNWPQDYRREFVIHAANHLDLERLEVDGTGGVEDLDKLKKLRILGLGYLNLEEIDVSTFPPLEELYVACNLLTSLDLSSQPTLRRLGCNDCRLQTLDVSCLPELEWLDAAPQNTLKTIYVAAGQEIPDITKDRSDRFIPPQTELVVK